MTPLFDSNLLPRSQEQLEDGAMLLRGFAAADAPVLVDEVARIAETAAFRHMVTPGGYTMSVAMTNCGRLGWVSDRTGYRCSPVDPPGAKLSLHQDRDEKDAWAPIVSVSLGLPVVFLWGGKRRSDPVRRPHLESGDIAVWGGPARFVYHGVATLKDGQHQLTGAARINLTFRKVF
jgi:alkylated DNA repair protein (DNA oxidative demethylase)